jgi:hypothetical protein
LFIKKNNPLPFALILLLTACGGGGGDNGGAAAPEVPEANAQPDISTRGFVESGLFIGNLDGTEVLLLMQKPDYFLLAGEFASRGSYAVTSIEMTGSGTAYDLSDGENQAAGSFEMRGTYRTDRHLDVAWQDPTTSEQHSLIVEASQLYFDTSPIDNVLGAWINQDEGNLTFFSISQNNAPIAGDDFVAVDPGAEVEIDVLSNDRDLDGDTIFITDVDSRSSEGGELRIDDNGTPDDKRDDRVFYTPPDGLREGTDTFGYNIEDTEEGGDDARVTVTLPIRDTDVGLSMASANEAPMAGDVVNVATTLVNSGTESVQVQVRFDFPSGLSYQGDEGAGGYDEAKGFWAVRVPAGGEQTLRMDLRVADYGDFMLTTSITSLDAVDQTSSDNTAELTFVPGGLSPTPPIPLETAQIEGVILSSLTQISGSITESTDGFNAYSISLSLGAGGLGSGSSNPDAYIGFAIISEEIVEEANPDDTGDGSGDAGDGSGDTGNGSGDTSDGSGDTGDGSGDTGDGTGDATNDEPPEPRPTMLVLTGNASGVYLNKLFYVSEEEISEDN